MQHRESVVFEVLFQQFPLGAGTRWVLGLH
jgi:hypothetical protein